MGFLAYGRSSLPFLMSVPSNTTLALLVRTSFWQHPTIKQLLPPFPSQHHRHNIPNTPWFHPVLPHLYSSLQARLDDGACALDVDSLKQPSVIAGRGRGGAVEDQGHVLQSWQQSLGQDLT